MLFWIVLGIILGLFLGGILDCCLVILKVVKKWMNVWFVFDNGVWLGGIERWCRFIRNNVIMYV